MLELDNAGCVRYANPAAVAMLGYEPRELNGVDYRVLINMREDGRTDAVRQVRYTTNILGGVGALLRRKNGQTRPVEYKIVPVIEEGVSLGTVLVFRDMDERVRLDNLLKDMQTTARIGGWEYDVPAKRVFWTEVVYSMFDLAPGQPMDAEARSLSILRRRNSRSCAAPPTIRSIPAPPRTCTCTRPSARGRKLWVRVIMKAERRSGKIARLHGTVQDVTDLVNAERQLRETRDFFDLTLNAVPMPIAYVSQEGDVAS